MAKRHLETMQRRLGWIENSLLPRATGSSVAYLKQEAAMLRFAIERIFGRTKKKANGMGMFDYVTVTDPRFVCSEGHVLTDESFQTKSFANQLLAITIAPDGITQESDAWNIRGEPPIPLLGRYQVYASCTQCPTYIHAMTATIYEVWCEFELEVVDDAIRSITRTSSSTAEQIASWLSASYRDDLVGPLPYNIAAERRAEHLAANLKAKLKPEPEPS